MRDQREMAFADMVAGKYLPLEDPDRQVGIVFS
jgi:hypothetical protein